VLARALGAFLGSAAGVAWQARQPLLVALGVGSVLGLGCYLAGPVVSSAEPTPDQLEKILPRGLFGIHML